MPKPDTRIDGDGALPLPEDDPTDRRTQIAEKRGVQMEGILLLAGRLAALIGVLVCAWSAYARLTGAYFVAGFQIGTLLLAGMAAMMVACVCFLLVLTGRPRR